MLKQIFDSVACAMYLQVSELPVNTTIEVTPSIYIDLAEDGSPVGAEVLGVASDRPFRASAELLESMAKYNFPTQARIAMGDAGCAEGGPPVTAGRAQLLSA